MSVAKVIEITASSKKSIESAVRKGVKRANKSVDNIQSVWVQDVKGVVRKGEVVEWRANLKVTFMIKG